MLSTPSFCPTKTESEEATAREMLPISRPLAYPAPRPGGNVSEVTSTSVLQRIAAGDESAVAECLSLYSGLVWTIARRFTNSQEEAEDATQEVFVDLWKSASRFDPEKAAEKTFVAMIARRRVIDRLRKATRAPETTPLSETVDPAGDDERRIEAAAEVGLASKAIATLRPEQRRLVLLATVHGMSHREIAEVTQTPLGTVKSTIRRSLATVRDLLTVPGTPSEGVSS